jgi:hypothetical protein
LSLIKLNSQLIQVNLLLISSGEQKGWNKLSKPVAKAPRSALLGQTPIAKT